MKRSDGVEDGGAARLLRVGIRLGLPLAAFLVGQVVVVMAGVFGLLLRPDSGLPLGWGLLSVPLGGLALLVTIHVMQAWARERERLRQRGG